MQRHEHDTHQRLGFSGRPVALSQNSRTRDPLRQRLPLLQAFPMTVFAIGAIMFAIALFTAHSGA